MALLRKVVPADAVEDDWEESSDEAAPAAVAPLRNLRRGRRIADSSDEEQPQVHASKAFANH
eukprot:3798995-Pleurochrysis_carterae.AAC.1